MATKPPLPVPPPAVAGPSTARRQPLRQARTARKPVPKPMTNGVESSAHHLPPAKFYPALTAFTDAVDALPSEIIRHFTLLREADAKACLPEANLRMLIDAAQRLPAAEDPYKFDAAMEALKQLDDLRRRRESELQFAANPAQAALLSELEKFEAADTAAPGSQTILGAPETRRARCHQIRAQIADLLVTQEEKIHVITTAVDALQKHLARVEHAFAYVEVEIPEIYRLGNPEHWAYKEPMKRGTAAQIAREKERERREQEERFHQAQMERESNVRGGPAGRGQTGKNSHHHYAHHQHQEEQHEPAKKKVRKTGDNETLSSTKRIADQQAGAQQQQQAKKRKASTKDDKEKTANVKGTASPRAGTPAPKKAKSAAQRAPRRAAQTPTASTTNSPLLGPPTIPLPHTQLLSTTTAASLHTTTNTFSVPSVAAALASVPAIPPPPTSAANKSHTKKETPKPVELEDAETLPALRYSEVSVKEKEKEKEREKEAAPPPPPAPKVSHKKKQRVPSPDTAASEEQSQPSTKKGSPIVPPPKKDKDDSAVSTKTKSSTSSHAEPKGTASGAGTPGGSRNRKRADSSAVAAMAAAAAAAVVAAPAKKSHKAKSQQKPVVPVGLGITTSGSTLSRVKEGGAGAEAGGEEEDEGEETYCYCNQISYGEMVACDGEECEREWFHLDCVGLSQAPRGKTKWYCNDCSKSKRGASRA